MALASAAALSPAGQALGLGSGTTAESEEERKRRLKSLAASQQNIRAALGANGGLTAAGSSLLGLGALGG